MLDWIDVVAWPIAVVLAAAQIRRGMACIALALFKPDKDDE